MQEIIGMPSKGQFVAVWEYNNEIWSNTVKIEDGKVFVYSEHHDDWVRDRLFLESMEHLEDENASVRYYVV